MAGFRALLVGVPQYRDEKIPALPFVRTDLAALDMALSRVGYDVQQNPTDSTSRGDLQFVVQSFLRSPRNNGETLLLYFNGHGVHPNGADYLVPHDARPSYEPFSQMCIPLDVNSDIERSRAGNVVVFIDACREGFNDALQRGRMGMEVARWSMGTRPRVAHRKVAYVFSCSTGEYARFVTDTGTGTGMFSVFSQAFAELVADETGPSTLAEFETALQEQVDQIGQENHVRSQRVRVLTESDKTTFVVVPRGGPELARVRERVAELSRTQVDEKARYDHIGPRIAGLPAPPPVDIAALRVELDVAARAGGWRDAAPKLTDLAERCQSESAALRAWGDRAEVMLRRRNELREQLAA